MKTYGRLEFDRTQQVWRIGSLEPHVAIAFKRLFPRVKKTQTDITLRDADEVRADLHWFLQRYPLAHGEADELRAGKRRMMFREVERERILMPTWRAGETVGFREGKAPYRYQSQAAAIALRNPGLLLGDDVGLGKTITAAATFTSGAPLPAAVVVQPHLAPQWAKRIEEFTTLRTHVIRGAQPYDLPPSDVYVFRYSNVAGWVDILKTGLFPTVAYDEIQELRHGRETSKGVACGLLTDMSELRLGLTATPIYNYGDEMFRVIGFIKPDLLGSYEEFYREWCGNSRIIGEPDALGTYLRSTGYFLRRTEDDPSVSGSMPPPNVIDWEVDYDAATVKDEEELLRSLAMTVMNGSFVEAGQASRDLDLRLRQITGVAKARAVAAYVRLLLREAPRLVLCGWHREVYSIWLDELAAFNPVMYTGSESTAGKNRSFEAFAEGRSWVLIISLRSGAGLDGLQHNCQDIVFGELDWSPEVHHQLIGRLRRPGQTGQVNAHYLHTNGGSDPVLLETLGIKRDQARGINDPGVAPKEKYRDDSRIRRLAHFVLTGEALPEGQAA